jgi:hypothetical protein
MSTIDAEQWGRLIDDTQDYLAITEDHGESDPVPRDELAALVHDNGYGAERNEPAASDLVDMAVDDGFLIEDSGGIIGVCSDPEDTVEPAESGSMDGGEAGSSTDNPEGETPEDTLTERAHAAFADAITFYQNQLETEIPVEYADTPREYYEDCRGWSPETVEQKQLGYAPGTLEVNLSRSYTGGDTTETRFNTVGYSTKTKTIPALPRTSPAGSFCRTSTETEPQCMRFPALSMRVTTATQPTSTGTKNTRKRSRRKNTPNSMNRSTAPTRFPVTPTGFSWPVVSPTLSHSIRPGMRVSHR